MPEQNGARNNPEPCSSRSSVHLENRAGCGTGNRLHGSNFTREDLESCGSEKATARGTFLAGSGVLVNWHRGSQEISG